MFQVRQKIWEMFPFLELTGQPMYCIGTADVLHHMEADVLFPYTISQYGGFSHTDEEINSLNS